MANLRCAVFGTGFWSLYQIPAWHEVGGVDIDPDALRLTTEKALSESLAVSFLLGSATDLPFPNGSFDRVCTSLLLHHLMADQKNDSVA